MSEPKRQVLGFPALQPGDGARRSLGPVRTSVQKCAVCKGAGHLARDHAFWEYSVRSPYDRKELPPPPTTVVKLTARRLYEDHQGRCPGCGGHGKVLISYAVGDHGALVPLGIMHYDDRGLPPDELAHLTKMNPTA